MKARIALCTSFMFSSVQAFASTESWLTTIVNSLPTWSLKPYFTLSLWQWIGLGGIVLVGLIVAKLINLLFKAIHSIASKRSSTKWDDLVIEAFVGPIGLLAAAGLWYISIFILDLNAKASKACSVLIQLVLSIALIFLAYRLTNVFIRFLYSVTKKTESDLDDQLMPVVEKSLRFLVLIIGSLIALQNLGINVVSAIAGLGIGGLAFALAAKDTAANMFGSLTIFMDQPFKMGDWVKINGTYEGIVEAIGIRTTRIRSFAKTEIILPNAVVANSSIENISRRPFRRTSFKLGITYSSGADKVELAVAKIREVLDKHPLTQNELTQVNFVDYAASSLDILIFFFLDVPGWTEELKAKQEIYLSIMRAFEEIGVEFAFPSQSLYVESMPK